MQFRNQHSTRLPNRSVAVVARSLPPQLLVSRHKKPDSSPLLSLRCCRANFRRRLHRWPRAGARGVFRSLCAACHPIPRGAVAWGVPSQPTAGRPLLTPRPESQRNGRGGDGGWGQGYGSRSGVRRFCGGLAGAGVGGDGAWKGRGIVRRLCVCASLHNLVANDRCV